MCAFLKKFNSLSSKKGRNKQKPLPFKRETQILFDVTGNDTSGEYVSQVSDVMNILLLHLYWVFFLTELSNSIHCAQWQEKF